MIDRDAELAAFEERIGYTFVDRGLLDLALTHPSWANEHGTPHNQRLEFLGDAVLDAVVVHMLYRRFPKVDEGVLSQQKHRLVCTESLSEIGRDLGLPALLKVGAGARKKGVARNPQKVEDTTEAVAGAIFLDAGFDRAARVIEAWLLPRVDALALARPRRGQGYKNAVSLLHERVARKPVESRAIAVELGRSGTEHEPMWEVGWWVGGTILATGRGANKKIAAREAARQAIDRLDALLEEGWRPDPDAEPPQSEVS